MDESQLTFEDDADDYFELYDNENVVIILPYDGDMDDRVLEEMKPRFVIMYEPNPAFTRRVEVQSVLVWSDYRYIERLIQIDISKSTSCTMKIRLKNNDIYPLCERKRTLLLD